MWSKRIYIIFCVFFGETYYGLKWKFVLDISGDHIIHLDFFSYHDYVTDQDVMVLLGWTIFFRSRIREYVFIKSILY